MPSKLIPDNFIAEFKDRIGTASKVQIASAWMRESEALAALLKRKQLIEVEALIGISGNATSPTSLTKLARAFRWKSLRIAKGTNLFHPKLFLFHCDEEPTVAWIGSANFTAHGMAGNTELMLETDNRSVVAAMVRWFEEQWDALRDQDTKKEVDKYASQWKEPNRHAGDQGGSRAPALSPPRRTSMVIRFHPGPRKGRMLCGKIVYGRNRGEQYEYKGAAGGLRWFLVWLATGREEEFLTACKKERPFHKVQDKWHFIGRGRTESEAIRRGKVSKRKDIPVNTLPGFEKKLWKWWISEDSNTKQKWAMVEAAVEVANTRFGDRIELKDKGSPSWPDKIMK